MGGQSLLARLTRFYWQVTEGGYSNPTAKLDSVGAINDWRSVRTDIIRETIPNIPSEILDQLARVNEQPAIHRYVQLHNSFELVVRYLAITSYLWVEQTGKNPELLAKLAKKLHRPSLETWNEIFRSCAKCLHEGGYLARTPKEDIDSEPATRTVRQISELAQTDNAPKRASSTGLLQSVILYRNLTRGHGCVIHDGYESFIEDLDATLCDFVLFWTELLNVKSVTRTAGIVLQIGGDEIPASLFLRANDEGRTDFYNRRETSGGNDNYYFLNYDTGLHRVVPDQGQRIDEDVRLHQSALQLTLFPVTKAELEKKYDRRAIHKIKGYLSFDYGASGELHPAQEEEIRFLVGLALFSQEIRSEDPIALLLKRMRKSIDQTMLTTISQRVPGSLSTNTLRRRSKSSYTPRISTKSRASSWRESKKSPSMTSFERKSKRISPWLDDSWKAKMNRRGGTG